MPNINSLPSITTPTSSTYVIVTDNGFARKLSVTELTDVISNSVAGDNRTDQPLFTTSSVIFNSIILYDNSTSTIKLEHGFTTFSRDYTGGSIKRFDPIGHVKFGGYDGVNEPSNETEPSFVFSSFATEDYHGVTGTGTNAGAGWLIAVQPSGTRFSEQSRQRLMLSTFPLGPTYQGTATLPPINLLRIGSGIDGRFPTLVTSSGTNMQPGFGRTDVEFINSAISIVGVTRTDPTPENNTVTSTNFLSFFSSRSSAVLTRRRTIKNNDSLGGILFNATVADETTSSQRGSYTQVGSIVANALEDFTSSTQATELVFYTNNASASPNTTKLVLSEIGNDYISNKHTFKTVNQTNVLDVSSTEAKIFNGAFAFHSTGTLVFPDNTVQTTAYNGNAPRAVSVPTSSGSAGNVGDIAWDAAYVYFCVAPNTWRRSVATGF